MCGIVHYIDFRGKSVAGRTINRFQSQRHRGTNGFGYYLPIADRLSHSPSESRLLRDLKHQAEILPMDQTSEVMFHHRFPTSTDNVRNACHPFSTRWEGFKNNYVLVHNGWLTNDLELHDNHYKMGIRYVSEQPNGQFNDSEALLYDLALWLEGYQDEPKAKGAIAFTLIERVDGKQSKLHFGRNTGSPLIKKYKAGKYLALASEGKGKMVRSNELNTFDYATATFTVKPTIFREYASAMTPKFNRGLPQGVLYDLYEGREHIVYYANSPVEGELCHHGTDDDCPLIWPMTYSVRTPQPSVSLHLPLMHTPEIEPLETFDDDDAELLETYSERNNYDPELVKQAIGDELVVYRVQLEAAKRKLVEADEHDMVGEFIAADDDVSYYTDMIDQLTRILALAEAQGATV